MTHWLRVFLDFLSPVEVIFLLKEVKEVKHFLMLEIEGRMKKIEKQ